MESLDKVGDVEVSLGEELDSSVERPSRKQAETRLHALGTSLFLNRELSWLEFNQRVLGEAMNDAVPLLERLKFAGITSLNLDEFFMVRVAGLVEQVADGLEEPTPDGMTPAEQLQAISVRIGDMLSQLGSVVEDELLPALEKLGVELVRTKELGKKDRKAAVAYFREQVQPVLTPLALDPGHPFPWVRNKSLNVVIELSGAEARKHRTPAFAVVQVPDVLARLVALSPAKSGAQRYALLEDVIAAHAEELFPGFRVEGAWPFRVIRNFDLSVDDEDAEDLLETIKRQVRRRHRGGAVHMLVDENCSARALSMLTTALGVDERFVRRWSAPMAPHDLSGLARSLKGHPELLDEPVTPVEAPAFRGGDNIFDVIRGGDVILHHPYESFDPVVAFIEGAADDPDVLAIKQTLYRTSGDSPIVGALTRAAEQGKQVTALVEIKARFDEENNIHWARKLADAGVHVVYGLVGLKTHTKAALVVRREDGKLRRYVHLGTGNYNPSTARLYTDLSYFTASPAIGEDATALFNLLTSCTAPRDWKKFSIAPLGLHETVMGLIEREAAYARAGKPARIVAKMNSLVDPDVIKALYLASMAGVEIDLLIRGICCLRPQLAGVSDNIRVHSVVDRFLEHSRVFMFEAGGQGEVFASSADWMPRNFHRRVEVMFPIEEPALKKRIGSILEMCLADNVKAYTLDAKGRYTRAKRGGKSRIRSQMELVALAKEEARLADEQLRIDRPFLVRPVRTTPTQTPELALAPDPEGRPRTPDPLV